MLLLVQNLSWISETIAWVLIVLIILFSILLSLKSNLLRDDIDDAAAFAAKARIDPRFTSIIPVGATDQQVVDLVPHPYSLSRVQLMIWTVVISCSYIFLSLYRHCHLKDINQTALILMGISIGTAGLANVIDQSQSQANAAGALPVRHQNSPSNGFLSDILSDENGVSVHRYQNVVWTVIAIIIYTYKVYHDHGNTLPDLDDTIIALTGISGAAYLGLKVNENAKKS